MTMKKYKAEIDREEGGDKINLKLNGATRGAHCPRPGMAGSTPARGPRASHVWLDPQRRGALQINPGNKTGTSAIKSI